MPETDRIQLFEAGGTVRVHWGDQLIAESQRARCLTETGYPDRHYIPMDDVAADTLVVSETTTHCPFKGDATYYHVHIDGDQLDDAAWCYAQPLSDMADIAGHLAFDHDALVIEHDA